MAVGFVASASSGSQASVATFNIGTLGTGARAGIVFVCIHNSATDIITGVTWNGVDMNLLYKATDTDTEPGVVKAYFLDNVTNGTITVSRTNNAVVTVGYAASISALRVTRAYETITRVSSTQNTNADTSTTGTGASGEVAVDDGSPGTSSMRFAAAYSGAATPPLQGTNSTNLQVLDSTAFGSRFVRETTAGQGSRNVGFATGTTDDWALVAVAVREEPALTPQPTAASLTLTGDTPTVVASDNKTAVPTAASMTLTGSTPTVTISTIALPTAASLTLTGATPTVATPVVSQPTAASLVATGATPVIAAAVLPTAAALVISPDASVSVTTLQDGGPSQNEIQLITVVASGGTFRIWGPGFIFDLSGLPWDISIAALQAALDDPLGGDGYGYGVGPGNSSISGSPGSYVYEFTGDYANQNQSFPINADGSNLTAGAFVPTVTVTDNVFSEPTAASLATTGATPVVASALSVPAASLVLAGDTPAIVLPVTTIPDAASLALTGATPTVATPVVAAPDAAALELAGATPDIVLPVAAQPGSAALVVTGATPSVAAGAGVTALPDAAALAVSGAIPTIGERLAVPALALSVSGAVPDVVRTANILALPSAPTLRLVGKRPLVDSGQQLIEIAMGWEPPVERIPNPQRVVPGRARLRMAFATPDVRVGDDADIMALLG